jgi:hypothetical protein
MDPLSQEEAKLHHWIAVRNVLPSVGSTTPPVETLLGSLAWDLIKRS